MSLFIFITSLPFENYKRETVPPILGGSGQNNRMMNLAVVFFLNERKKGKSLS